ANLAEQPASAFKIAAPFQSALNDRREFVDGPLLDELPASQQLLRGLPFRPGFQNRLERRLFLLRQRGDRVVLHVPQEPGEAGAAFEVGGLEEPAQVLPPQGPRPAGPEDTQRASIL